MPVETIAACTAWEVPRATEASPPSAEFGIGGNGHGVHCNVCTGISLLRLLWPIQQSAARPALQKAWPWNHRHCGSLVLDLPPVSLDLPSRYLSGERWERRAPLNFPPSNLLPGNGARAAVHTGWTTQSPASAALPPRPPPHVPCLVPHPSHGSAHAQVDQGLRGWVVAVQGVDFPSFCPSVVDGESDLGGQHLCRGVGSQPGVAAQSPRSKAFPPLRHRTCIVDSATRQKQAPGACLPALPRTPPTEHKPPSKPCRARRPTDQRR